MRVLYITHYADMYGANYSLLNMILFLRDKYQVEPIVLLNESGSMIRELEANRIKYYIRPYPRCSINITGHFIKIKKIIKKVLRFISYKRVIKEISKINQLNHIDMIHSNSSMVDIGYYISKKIHCQHIWHIREYGIEDYNLEQIDGQNKICKRYADAAYIVAISDSIKKMVNEITPYANVKTIYNGVKSVDEYNKQYCQDGRMHFCVVGLISPQKNQIEVIQAIKKICKDDIKKMCLHIVGGDFKGEQDKLIKYIKENKLEENVIFEGYIENINKFLRRMDVGIMPSVKEAFGRVTIEYMENYMPVIGSASGGTKELIKTGYNGYLYESGDSAKLAEYMELCIKNPQVLTEMGKNAKEFSKRFSIETNAQKVYELYLSV